MNTINEQLRYDSREHIRPPQGFCPGCGVAQAMRLFLKAIGGNAVIVTPPGCSAPSISFPQPSLVNEDRLIDVLHCPFGSAAIFAGGLKSALEARGNFETQVIAWAGDGASFDIGFGALSAAAKRNEDIIYVCYDNEAYMNTGNQKSGSTPTGAITTTGSPAAGTENRKDLIWIMMGHEIPYAATATVAYPDDLMEKASKAAVIKGFRFFHILTPCVAGWRFPPHLTVRMSKLAVQTRIFPLVEVQKGDEVRLKTNFNRHSLEEYIRLQGRFRNLAPSDMKALEKEVDRRWEKLLNLKNYLAQGLI